MSVHGLCIVSVEEGSTHFLSHRSVKETTGELAKVYITGRECRVSEHEEVNTKGFTLASSACQQGCLPQVILCTAASIFP